MKFAKHFVVLAILLCAFPTLSHAQQIGTVQALGGGSSAIFLELGQTAQSSSHTATPCVWSQKSVATVLAEDKRTSPETDEQGNIWITWSQGTGTGHSCATPQAPYDIYAYMQLDSTVGNKCYFMVDATGTGCILGITIAANTASANLILGSGENAIPSDVITSLNGQRFGFAGTDIRPEDAKFATFRAFQQCGSQVFRNPFDLGERMTFGLGYQTTTAGVGLSVNSAFSSKKFNVIDFNIAGNDPFTNKAVPTYLVTPIGAQPIVVTVAPVPSGGTGIGAATDINGFTLSLFYEGVLARSTDLNGPSTANGVTTLVREPLSGTYNVMEYSMPNSSQFHTSQDDNFCNGTAVFSQTMNIASGVGNVTGARRARVIGTGEMVSTLQAATTDTLGYFFWSAGNANSFTATNGKYLTVNGLDPLLDRYDEATGPSGANCNSTGPSTPNNGLFPTAANGNLPCVTFKALNNGDYPIWTPVRLITPTTVPAGIGKLQAALAGATQHDYITPANLKVWHSHFPLNTINATAFANGTSINTPNDLCNTTGAQVEAGGDAGGTNVLKQVNADFCSDFSNPQGLINKVN